MAQQDLARSLAERMVYDYNRNPYGFSFNQGQQIARFAAIYGLDFKPESKGLKKFFYNLVNTGSLGALGLAMDAPRETGEEYGFGTTRGKIGGALGSLGGMATPIGIGGMLGGAALKGAAKLAPAAAKAVKARPVLEQATRWGATGAGIGGTHDLIGDPSGLADRATTGAMFGGGLGAIGGAISRFRRPEAFNLYGNQVPKLEAHPEVMIMRGQMNKALPQGPSIPQLPMGGAPRRMGLPSPNQGMQVAGRPISLGGKSPYMNDDMESIVNAIRNARGQQRYGLKAAVNRMKSENDMARLMKGNPVDDMAFNRTPAFTNYGRTGYEWSGTGYGVDRALGY